MVGTACSSPDVKEAGAPKASATSPGPPASHAVLQPTLYFNLSQEDALSYLENLDRRALEALHEGDLGALHDIYTHDGPAGAEASATIIRQFRKELIDSTDIEVRNTKVLRITSQLAVFRQVRLVWPCIYTVGDGYDATPDHRVLRQVLIRYMADERLNWRIHRDVIEKSVPTGEKVAACP
jgi:hypothetical protein